MKRMLLLMVASITLSATHQVSAEPVPDGYKQTVSERKAYRGAWRKSKWGGSWSNYKSKYVNMGPRALEHYLKSNILLRISNASPSCIGVDLGGHNFATYNYYTTNTVAGWNTKTITFSGMVATAKIISEGCGKNPRPRKKQTRTRRVKHRAPHKAKMTREQFKALLKSQEIPSCPMCHTAINMAKARQFARNN